MAFSGRGRAAFYFEKEVFEAAFTSAMEEAKSATYTISDADPAAVEALLRFLYTGLAVSGPDAELDPAALLELAVVYQASPTKSCGLCSWLCSRLCSWLCGWLCGWLCSWQLALQSGKGHILDA